MWSEGAGKEKIFLNRSLIFSLLTAKIGKKIKCQGIIYKTSQYVLVTGCSVWLAKRQQLKLKSLFPFLLCLKD